VLELLNTHTVLTIMCLCVLLGSIVGVMAGLLGIGGGLIIVPIAIFMFQHVLGVSIEHAMPLAVATSLSTVIFTGFSSAVSHYRLGNLDMDIFRYSAVGIAIGATLGAQFATAISGVALKRTFAVLVLLITLQMLFGRDRPFDADGKVLAKNTKTYGLLSAIGLGSGSVSALMGIGGGALIVPSLVWFNIHIRQAIACASACGVLIAIFGTLSFMYAGWHNTYLPDYSLGYVYLPATLGIVISSIMTAPIGAKLTTKINTVMLKRIFAVFLAMVSLRMMIGIE